MNKKVFITISIIVIAVAICVTAAALIYNSFFKDNYEKEQAAKIIHEELDKNKEDAEKLAEEIAKLAGENDVFGTYVATYNEIDTEKEESYMYTPTNSVTSVMQLNEDLTCSFSDTKGGWWSMIKDKNNLITVTVGVQGEQKTRDYLKCGDVLIDTTEAVFWGEIPDGSKFDLTLTDGVMEFKFKKDGTVSAVYSDKGDAATNTAPWSEAYSGQYQRNGDYLDIVLNGNHARYLVFKNTDNPSAPLMGIASRYYIKSDV